MSLNRATVIGYLGGDPVLMSLPSGQPAVGFSVATDEFFTDKEGQKQDRVQWHQIVVFGKLAETCHQYLKKGREVYVEGRLRTREYEAQNNGGKRQRTEIIAARVQFLGSNQSIWWWLDRQVSMMDATILPRRHKRLVVLVSLLSLCAGGCLELRSANPSAITTESFTHTFDPERCRSFGPYYHCPQTAVLPNARHSLAEYDDSEDAFEKLNQYRKIAALPPLREDPTLSDGATKHARYLVKNAEHVDPAGPYAHTEDPGNQWFSPQGLAAAQHSDVIPPMREPLSAGQAINMWVSGPSIAL